MESTNNNIVLTAEETLLNRILDTGDFTLLTTNNIDADKFIDFKPEFNFIKNHFEAYGCIPDKQTFHKAYKEFRLVSTTEPTSYILEEFLKEYQYKSLALSFNLMKQYLENENLNKAKELLKEVSENIEKNSTTLEAVDIVHDVSRFDRYEERVNGKDNFYVSTGFKELDLLVGGIDRQNENMVISARTGIGKTMLLIKIAEAVSKAGLTVGFFEGEMTVDKLANRYDTMRSHISNIDINRGNPFIYNQYKQYTESLKTLENEHVYVLTSDKIGGPATVDALAAFVDKYHLDILFVDQYSLLDSTSSSNKENEKIAAISKAIKKLQVRKKIPVISVSQNNRTKNDDGSKDSTQIGGSDRIGQDATIILMLDKKDGVLDIDIVKARDGGDGHKLQYDINFNTGVFTYIPREGDGVSTAEDLQNLGESYSTGDEDVF